jgi:hypothetical protein
MRIFLFTDVMPDDGFDDLLATMEFPDWTEDEVGCSRVRADHN